MIRLVRAEVARLLSRRFTILTLIAVLLGLGLFQLVVADAVSPPSAADVAANRAGYEQELKDWQDNREQWEKECVDAGERPADCASYFPQPSESDYGLQAVPFAEIGAVAGPLAVYLGALALFLLAASFIGAEFTSGAIANWLSFVPRRSLVFTSKLVTIVAFAIVVSALASALTLGVAALLTVAFGGELNGLRSLLGQSGRGLMVAVVFAVIGFCAGLVTRHTAAAIGVLLGYLFLWFLRNAILFEAAWAQRLTRWSAEGNIAAILGNGYRYQVPVERLTEDGLTTDYVERTISLTQGLTYWAVVLVVVVTAALLIFRRRDVT
jgi:ABC-2 type transport system permease protein